MKDLVSKVHGRFIGLYSCFSRLTVFSGDTSTMTAIDGTSNAPSGNEGKDSDEFQEDTCMTSSDQEDACVDSLVVKVQVLYLACLQTLVKMNPKSFHSEWPRLLGTVEHIKVELTGKDSLVPLTYFVVNGTSPRLRHAAAASISTLIEGPAQRAYLGLGEHDTSITSFISLSQSLGQIIVTNVDALTRCILSENDDMVCCSVIRALTTFLVGCSWNKISSRYLWSSIRVLHEKMGPRDGTNNELLFTCMHSLATLFSLKIAPPAGDLSAVQNAFRTSRGEFLSDTLASWVIQGRMKIKLEAILAIRGMVRLQLLSPQHMSVLYEAVVDQTDTILGYTSNSKQHSTVAERLQQQFVLVIGDLSSHILDEQGKSPCDITVVDICCRIIIPGIDHTSPRVRSASFTSLASLPPAFWDNTRISESVSSILVARCTKDSESTVRSSAMRAYGSWVQSMDIERLIHDEDILTTLRTGLQDSVLAVRIPCAVILEAVSCRLWQASMENLGMWKDRISGVLSFAGLLHTLLQCVCSDHDKVRVHGIHALGYLLGTKHRLTVDTSLMGSKEDWSETKSTSRVILDDAMARGSLAVQWASYEACRIILLTARLTDSTQDEHTWKHDSFIQSVVEDLQKQRDTIAIHEGDGTSRTRMLLDQALLEFS